MRAALLMVDRPRRVRPRRARCGRSRFADGFERALGKFPVAAALAGLRRAADARSRRRANGRSTTSKIISSNASSATANAPYEAWAGDRIKATAIGGGVGMVLAGDRRRARCAARRKRWPWIAIAGMPATAGVRERRRADVHHAAVQQIHSARRRARSNASARSPRATASAARRSCAST